MLSLLDNSGRKTALVALRNCVYLLPLGFAAYHGERTARYQSRLFHFLLRLTFEILQYLVQREQHPSILQWRPPS